MNKFIMGIDGGGTKSHIAMFYPDGKCVGVASTGALNHELLPGAFVEMEEKVQAFILGALKDVGATVDDVEFMVQGQAGVDTAAQHVIVSKMLTDIGMNRFTLCNDSFLGVATGCPDNIGLCAINGTGSTMAAIDHSGNTVQICGVGEISNDCGGSGWYGGKVMGAVYGALFKCEQPTILTEMMWEILGITRKEDHLDIIAAATEEQREAINRLVFKAAELGDAVALKILDESAMHYVGGFKYLATDLDFPIDKTLYITYIGSVFVKEKVRILPQLIAKYVAEALPGRKVEYINLEAPPVVGAVLWAANRAGYKIGMDDVKAGISAAGL